MDRTNTEHEPQVVKQMSLAEFDRMFPDEASCKEYLVHQRWPNGIRCPRCGNDKVYPAGAKRPYHWACHKCGKPAYRFSLYVGTIFENTNYPLRTWFKVLHLMMVSKKGISALQVHRMIDSGSYKTAFYMCHRLRAGLSDPDFRQLMGIVEVDETFIGGKRGKMHKSKRPAIGWGQSSKIPVIGAISRKGNVVCQMIERVGASQAERFIRKVVDSEKVELIATDEGGEFRRLKAAGYPHDTVDHKAEEYVRGLVHTQNLDNFWSMLKRGIVGTYHSVSKKYLPLYLNEFQFRFNNRKEADIFGKAIAGC
jgi:transposase-like protein